MLFVTYISPGVVLGVAVGSGTDAVRLGINNTLHIVNKNPEWQLNAKRK